MNRIILIGNGFDLAHGLKTSYPDFMANYWGNLAQTIQDEMFDNPEDELTKLERISGPDSFIQAYQNSAYRINNPQGYNYADNFKKGIIYDFQDALASVKSYTDLLKQIEKVNEVSDLQFKLSFKNEFFRRLSEVLDLHLWLDIENEYHEGLKGRALGRLLSASSIETYNKEFDQVKKRLTDYLTSECKKKEVPANKEIVAIIDSLINVDDIALSQQDLFLDNILAEYFEFDAVGEIEDELNNNPGYSLMRTPQEAQREVIRNWITKGSLIDYLRPKRTLLLNFNYTDTARKLYTKSENGKDYDLIHIHGELNNPANPIIFGYGDEMDEDYQKIVNLNKNEFMMNLKPIRYHETNHHTNLLAFISSAPYQIFIMGHSCGNSDRTVLNTLFEHKNCLSIKTFFHKKEDGTDNHLNTTQNISRHFKDAVKRNRVANKTLCQLHPQN